MPANTYRKSPPRGARAGRGVARIGISGWTYAPWRGTFFPKGLPQGGELAYAAERLASIEINGTFYSLQRPSSYAAWAEQAPEGFVFSVKGPRFITHIKRLKACRIPLANFFASGPLRLGEKLGPFLWQLPPSLRFDPGVIDAFLGMLPRTAAAAALLARRHDSHVRHGVWLKAGPDRPLRHAMEVRHGSFEVPEFIALLRKHRVALVVADTAGKWPALGDVTADFVYARLHGGSKLYVSGYGPAALRAWASRVEAWLAGRVPPSPRTVGAPPRPRSRRDVYLYFDNDVKTRAPFDAMALARLLGSGQPPRRAPAAARVLEEPRTVWPAYGARRRAGEGTDD
jgi:uncharacterized protein YecE (DUF72 family)